MHAYNTETHTLIFYELSAFTFTKTHKMSGFLNTQKYLSPHNNTNENGEIQKINAGTL